MGAVAGFILVLSAFFAAEAGACVPGKVQGYRAKYRSLKSGYYPHDSLMEGGFKDRNGRPLQTLQAYLRGRTPYVSVAMDHLDRRFPYGTVVRIPEIERHFGRCIEFRVVDTGGRFKGRGHAKIDICHDSERNTLTGISNGPTEIYVMNGGVQAPPSKAPPIFQRPQDRGRPLWRWGRGYEDDEE